MPVGEANENLRRELKELSLNVDYGEAHMPFEKEIDGVRYKLEENPMAWKWFQFDFSGEQGTITYENSRGVKQIKFGCNSLLQGSFPETHYYDRQVDVPSNRGLACMADLSWTEEKEILLRIYIVDSSLGNCFKIKITMKSRKSFFICNSYYTSCTKKLNYIQPT